MEYRLYFFTNFYLSSIQKGIQSGHCAVELMNGKFRDNAILREWATNHKTFIVLNGGAQPDLEDIFTTLELAEHNKLIDLPYAQFHEDIGLNNALTCVGIVIPSRIFNFTAANRNMTIRQVGQDKYVAYDYRGNVIEPRCWYIPTVVEGEAVTGMAYDELSSGDLLIAKLIQGKSLAN